MDEPEIIACLVDARLRWERGEAPDLESYRERLGDQWDRFRELISFDRAFGQELERPTPTRGSGTFGRYKLLRELARGGFGIVYEAHDESLDRVVALKTLRPEYDADPKFRRRYEREARSCAQVRHPNLVEIYDYGEADGRLYYAMPLLEGGSLSDAIGDGLVPPPPEVCLRMADVADAVGALHEANIVHRDIKPANIVVERDGRFVLADFGLARRLDLPAITGGGHSVGTPQYMSPEQLAGDPTKIDHLTDVYALGATLYEALHGQPPFVSSEIGVLYRRILKERPPPLERVAPHVSSAISRVVMRCLERRPADRYPSAKELAQELRAAARGEPVSARGPSALARWLPRGRQRSAAFIALALLVVLAGVLLTRPGDSGANGVGGAERPVIHAGTLDMERLEKILRYAQDQGLEVQITLSPASSLASKRGTGRSAPLQLVFPRGAVRPADLDSMRVDVTEAFEGEGNLVFLLGERTLATLPFEPGDYRNSLPIPQAVREAAQPGARLEWRYVPRRGDPVTARFEVVDTDLGATLAGIEEASSRAFAPAGLRSLLRALAFLKHDLGEAAYRELRGGVDDWSGTPAGTRLLWMRLRVEALQRAYGDDTAGLKLADAWHSALLDLDDAQEAEAHADAGG